MLRPIAASALVALLVAGAAAQPPKPDPLTGAGMSKEEALHRLRAVNDLRQLSLAVEAFVDNDRQGLFPPADGSGAAEQDVMRMETAYRRKGVSWRAQLAATNAIGFSEPAGATPAELQALRDALSDLTAGRPPKGPDGKPAEAWNDARFKSHALDALNCPVPGKTKEKWHTFYRVFVGGGAAFEPKKQLTRKDFKDGLDKTILVVEAGEAVPWPKPDELPYDPAKPLPKLGGLFADGFYAAFADGTVRFIKAGTDEKALRALITRGGGEPIAELPPKVDTTSLRKAAGLKD